MSEHPPNYQEFCLDPDTHMQRLVGGFKYIFHPYFLFGKNNILTNIFQMGWNHHLERR